MSKTAQSEDAYQQYRKEMYAAHITNRHNLDDLAFKTSERYDQWVLTLAGGALAISLTFLEKIAPEPAHDTLFLLGLSWLTYILAVLAGFCAIYYSRKAIYRALEIADENYRFFTTTSTEEKPQGDAPPELKNRPGEIVGYLNKASLSCLVAGTGLMCAFALANLACPKVSKDTDPAKAITVNVNLQQSSNNITNTTKENHEPRK
jgi:hypothetical protein